MMLSYYYVEQRPKYDRFDAFIQIIGNYGRADEYRTTASFRRLWYKTYSIRRAGVGAGTGGTSIYLNLVCLASALASRRERNQDTMM
jgi:hypothetical protein